MEQPKPINCVTSCEALVAAEQAKIKRIEKVMEKLHSNDGGLNRSKHMQTCARFIKELAQSKADLQLYKDHITSHSE